MDPEQTINTPEESTVDNHSFAVKLMLFAGLAAVALVLAFVLFAQFSHRSTDMMSTEEVETVHAEPPTYEERLELLEANMAELDELAAPTSNGTVREVSSDEIMADTDAQFGVSADTEMISGEDRAAAMEELMGNLETEAGVE